MFYKISFQVISTEDKTSGEIFFNLIVAIVPYGKEAEADSGNLLNKSECEICNLKLHPHYLRLRLSLSPE